MGLDQSMRTITAEQRKQFEKAFGRTTDREPEDAKEGEEAQALIDALCEGNEPFWYGRKENHIHAWVEQVAGVLRTAGWRWPPGTSSPPSWRT